jgi:histidinol dehydrogenase
VRRVEGFSKARPLLVRENSLESLCASPELAARIRLTFGEELSPQEVVGRIVGDVRNRGDKSLFDYVKKLDGVDLGSLEVSKREISAAYDAVDDELISALRLSARRIRNFHVACKGKSGIVFLSEFLGKKVGPLDRVGIYVPGGTAAYPSTVLMTAIPARVAGVEEIIMVSPAGRNGSVAAPSLVAADIAGVQRVFKIGGAQAIAALAFGTESVPRVDKVCGPGNVFVTLAKRMVYGSVAIDGLEGPSEIVIVADETANPAFCAADLLAQAEHDPLASVVMITTSSGLADRVEAEIGAQLAGLERRSVISEVVGKGIIALVDDVGEAIELVNIFAPEHVSLMVSGASALVPRIRHAGCIFVGDDSPVVLGDYVDGPSHVLPTGGSARFSSPLGVGDFLKSSNIAALDRATMRELAQAAIVIARAEGLSAHARAIEMRLSGGQTEANERS